MTAAFEFNLSALSMLALVVGMFLIYNTVTFSVVQRRPLFAVLRMLGATGGQLFALILGEAVLLSLVGSLLGLGLGVLLGRGVVGLITQTINDFWFAVNVQDVSVPGKYARPRAGRWALARRCAGGARPGHRGGAHRAAEHAAPLDAGKPRPPPAAVAGGGLGGC
jgi:hypothetical protein